MTSTTANQFKIMKVFSKRVKSIDTLLQLENFFSEKGKIEDPKHLFVCIFGWFDVLRTL